MKTERSEKIYVDFFGLSGGGKTTIYNDLAKALSLEKNIKAISAETELFKLNTFYRHTIPAIFSPLTTARIFSFCFGKLPSENKLNYKLFKYFFVDYFLFSTRDFKYFLNDGPLHFINNDAMPTDEKLIMEIINNYPAEKLYFVFLDTPPDVAAKRKTSRRKKALPSPEMISNYQEKYEKNKKVFSLFKEKEGTGKIKKIMRLDGRRSAKENISILKKEL